jgi:hypothetical protein
MTLRTLSLVRFFAMASLVAAAPLGCAQEGDDEKGSDSTPSSANNSGADELVAQVVFDAAVVKADSIEFPVSVVPEKVLRRIEAYQAAITPKFITKDRHDVFDRVITEQVVDMQDLLAQEQATNVESVILRGDRSGDIKPGDEINEDVVTNASGYLRRALSYELRGDTVVVRTGPATLAEYFGELKVGQEIIGPQQDGLATRSAPLVVPFNLNLVNIANRQLFTRNGTINTAAGPVNGNVSVAIQKALIALNGQIDVGIDVGFFTLNEAHVKVNGNLTGQIDFLAQANGKFSTSTGEIKILPRALKFALPPAGPVPLTLKVDATAKCDLNVNGSATATVGGNVNIAASAGFQVIDGDVSFIGNAPSFKAGLNPPQLNVSATANARCAVIPTLEVLMFDAAGPQIGIEGFANGKFSAGAAFGAQSGAKASAQVSIGANFLVGGEIQTPVFDFQLLDFGKAKVLGVESKPSLFVLR